MLILLALMAAPAQYGPEIEALMRHRDEQKRAEAAAALVQTQQKDELASVVPPAIVERLSACLARTNGDAKAGLAEAISWAGSGGGAYAAQCKGYALGKAERWAEAAGAFEAGAVLVGLDARQKARLWSQAGNAALAGGDAARAARDLDSALEGPMPRVLSTGETYLDRARARVALGNLPGARADLDQALGYAGNDPLAWLLSATLARRMNDLPLARAHIEQAAKLARSDPSVALEQGVIYALSGDRDTAARAAFTRAAQLAPGSETATKARAYIAQLGPDTSKPTSR